MKVNIIILSFHFNLMKVNFNILSFHFNLKFKWHVYFSFLDLLIDICNKYID